MSAMRFRGGNQRVLATVRAEPGKLAQAEVMDARLHNADEIIELNRRACSDISGRKGNSAGQSTPRHFRTAKLAMSVFEQ